MLITDAVMRFEFQKLIIDKNSVYFKLNYVNENLNQFKLNCTNINSALFKQEICLKKTNQFLQ